MGTHTGQIPLNSKPFEITAAKDKRAEMVVDRLIQRSGRGKRRCNRFRCIQLLSISIDARLQQISMFPSEFVRELTPSTIYPRPVDPKVSRANTSPSSILV